MRSRAGRERRGTGAGRAELMARCGRHGRARARPGGRGGRAHCSGRRGVMCGSARGRVGSGAGPGVRSGKRSRARRASGRREGKGAEHARRKRGEGRREKRKEKRKKMGKRKRKRKRRGERREKGERKGGIRAGITALIAEPVGHAWRPGARERDAQVEGKQGAGYGCRVFGESGGSGGTGRIPEDWG